MRNSVSMAGHSVANVPGSVTVYFETAAVLTFWRRNYFFNFSTHCIQNVNNTGTKQVRIMKQTAF